MYGFHVTDLFIKRENSICLYPDEDAESGSGGGTDPGNLLSGGKKHP